MISTPRPQSVTSPGEAVTTTITFDFDASAVGALRLSPREFAWEMRIAATIQWYAQGSVSRVKAAELAALMRAEFLEERHCRTVRACQVRADDLADENQGAPVAD